MNGSLYILGLSMAVTLIIGTAVFRTQPQRRTNQFFFLTCFSMFLWLAARGYTFFLDMEGADPAKLERWITVTWLSANFVPLTGVWLRLSIINRHSSLSSIVSHSWFWIIIFSLLNIICLHPTFITSIQNTPGAYAAITYGTASFFHVGVFIPFLIGTMILTLFYDSLHAKGIERAELQVVLTALFIAIAYVVITQFILPLFIARDKVWPFVSLGTVIYVSIIAYGVFTHRVLQASSILRRVFYFFFSFVYILALFFGVRTGVNGLLQFISVDAFWMAELIGLFLVVASISSVDNYLQKTMNRIFREPSRRNQSSVLIRKASTILQTIRTTDELLDRFSLLVRDHANTMSYAIYTLNHEDYVLFHSKSVDSIRPQKIQTSDRLITELMSSYKVINRNNIHRLYREEEAHLLEQSLDQIGGQLVVAIWPRNKLMGFLVLGERNSGRFYNEEDEKVWEIIAGQLAFSLQNAELFTQLRKSKKEIDLLLKNMVTGVISLNSNGIITMMNPEAQKIFSNWTSIKTGQNYTCLPRQIQQVIYLLKSQGKEVTRKEMVIPNDENKDFPMTLLVSTTTLQDENQEGQGLLLLVQNVTQEKILERQISRSERLASVGTIAASIAHEIRNPLTPLKTMTQLLPVSYKDEEFRERFLSIAPEQINRIERLVTKLVDFSNPSPPSFLPQHLYDIINQAIQLVSEDANRQGVTISSHFYAEDDKVIIDKDQIQQVVLNMMLNAIQAMPQGGELDITVRQGLHPNLSNQQQTEACLQIHISDTGMGIPADKLSNIFDLYYTTKSEGTGLGLSICQQIIEEHNGMIDVTSQLNKGTEFMISLPKQTENP